MAALSKIMPLQQAMDHVKSGDTIMMGGFYAAGTPDPLIDELIARGVKDLTIITNDTGTPTEGNGKLLMAKRIKKLICSFVGLTPEVVNQRSAGELEIELSPQGTLAERIRAGGSGLGGFYTPTGVGTVVAEGKPTMTANGKTYLFETPLWGDVCLMHVAKADTAGNLVCRRTGRNFNPVMAMAADKVIVLADEIVEVGTIDPDDVQIPGVLVDILVKS